MTVDGEHKLDIPPLTGRIRTEYDEPAIVEALKTCGALLEEARILEASRNRVGIVTLPMREEKTAEFVIKEFRIKGVNRWKSVLLPSKALKAWRGSLALVERGFWTPLPVAYCERKTSLFLDQSYFITEYVPGVEEVRTLFRELPQKELRPLLRELARYLARCTESGILHRDLSDGNVLVERMDDGQLRFFLLDTNRIRCRKRVGTFKGIKSLIRLGVPADLQRFFLKAYVSPSPVKGVHWLWYRMNKSCFSGYIGIKKLLRLKKLAQKLRIQ
ncbi:MAG: lipopolysaccharide kinase InaA family protein [Candidatus Aminicenantes bacterium]|jgi:serine/threonine protein kinase